MAEYTSPWGGRLGVVTDTTGVASGWEACELLIRCALCGERGVVRGAAPRRGRGWLGAAVPGAAAETLGGLPGACEGGPGTSRPGTRCAAGPSPGLPVRLTASAGLGVP